MSDDIRFVRIRGRIVPIKRKKVDGVALVAAASTVSVASSIQAAKLIRKSDFAYAKSANLRGMSKLSMGKGSTYNRLIKKSATFKILGKGIARKGFGVLTIGLGASAYLAKKGSEKLTSDSEKIAAASTLAAGAGLAVFGRKSGLGQLVKMASKINPKNPVSELGRLYKTTGIKKTGNTVRTYAKTAYKGFTPKKPSVYNAKQQDLFKVKKFDIKNWLKDI